VVDLANRKDSRMRRSSSLTSEISTRADFSQIRYAQCWEDADILLEALHLQPQHVCLSIASAGDNTLAMVSKGPQRVIALDLSPAQLACLELRVAAYRTLDHSEVLELLGVWASQQRPALYERCRSQLSAPVRSFWDANAPGIAQGFGTIGKFERYLQLFGRRILPLVQSSHMRAELLQPRSPLARERFYTEQWDNWRWRAVFQIFFSRRVMGWLGRDAEFFRYVASSVADRILARTRYALTVLDPTQNPYLQWILLGHYGDALPYALRPENFAAIRANLACLEWRCQSVEDFLRGCGPATIDRYNLSDIFEYMALDAYHALLNQLADRARSCARLVYWNMLAPRRRPLHMAERLRSLAELSAHLYQQDKAFFYSDFVVEEMIG
jgi:S-adenosylmethionine-diacylglycerol 3-amino-3-carboxypropyl transferase